MQRIPYDIDEEYNGCPGGQQWRFHVVDAAYGVGCVEVFDPCDVCRIEWVALVSSIGIRIHDTAVCMYVVKADRVTTVVNGVLRWWLVVPSLVMDAGVSGLYTMTHYDV